MYTMYLDHVHSLIPFSLLRPSPTTPSFLPHVFLLLLFNNSVNPVSATSMYLGVGPYTGAEAASSGHAPE